jgi:hypothetical protein
MVKEVQVNVPSETRTIVFRHHFLRFFKPASGISLLIVLGAVGFVVWRPLGAGLWLLAGAWATSAYLYWSWHTFAFTPDNRLIRRRGFQGCTQDIISLFGVVTPRQPPILGKWLDVGSVQINAMGDTLHIQQIADFHAFYRRLVYGAPHQEPSSPVQIFLQVPTSTEFGGERPVELPRSNPTPALAHTPAPDPGAPDRPHIPDQ